MTAGHPHPSARVCAPLHGARLALSGAAAALALVAAGFAANEAAVIRSLGGTQSGFLIGLTQAGVSLPMSRSLAGQTALLDRCAQVQLAWMAGPLGQPDRERAARACLDLAERALAASPSLPIGHLAVAVSSYHLGGLAAAQAALALSQGFGPNEGWVAERRVDFGLRLFADLDGPARAALARDVVLLASQGRSLPVLADRYLRHPEARAWLAQVIGTAPAESQGAFLRAVASRQGMGGT